MDRFFSYLNSLDDDDYFFVANTILGKVATPFHKPVVNNSILSFLLNRENRQNILLSLGEDDRRCISLVHVVETATAAQIASFFTDESFPMVLTKLESLCDRLILIKEGERYLENPVLKDIADQAYDQDLVFGEDKGMCNCFAHVDRNILFSVLNLLTNGSVPPREANAHHFTKSDRLCKVFPQFDKADSICIYSSLKALLVSEGAIKPADGRFTIDRERAKTILNLDDLNILVAALGTGFSDSVQRFLGILRSHSLREDQALAILGIFSDHQHPSVILQQMKSFGFISIEDGVVRLNPAVLEKPLKMSKVNVDSDLEVTYYGIPESDDILYLFADIVVCDKLIRYHITKDSFIRALELGLDSDLISSYLGTNSHDGQFSQWESSFCRIRSYDGIVICCDEQLSSLVQKHPGISSHVIADIGSGAFVMDRSQEWRDNLAYAMDLSHLPLPKGETVRGNSLPSFGKLSCSIAEPQEVYTRRDWDDGQSVRYALIADAKNKGCLTDEVKALIDAKLIVSKSQIGKGFRYASMQSIGGFDYSAKLSAIRNLLKKGKTPLLKLELPDSTLLVQPIELMKGDGILKVKVLPQCIEKSISVSSIFKATVMRWTLS